MKPFQSGDLPASLDPRRLSASLTPIEPVECAKPHASPWPIFWIASIAVFLVSLDSTLLFAAFGAIGASFPGTSAADMSWVLNGYTVVYAAMLIPAGGVADSHGRKKVFLFGATLFLAASAAGGLAGTVNRGWPQHLTLGAPFDKSSSCESRSRNPYAGAPGHIASRRARGTPA